ncbi:hypothetical protein BT93_J1669 [Corymbia citriodora subsp. variegata]|nr:hypothetical protein BT93_J1669 [Corymbia citriodora subsp. variegata]
MPLRLLLLREKESSDFGSESVSGIYGGSASVKEILRLLVK